MSIESATPAADRPALRRELLARRAAFVASDAGAAAQAALAGALCDALAALEPACIGLYCAMRSEFNAALAVAADARLHGVARALPYARRSPREMGFRLWDGAAPSLVDECGIGSCDGAVVVPDVVVVPCVGHTADGHRLGYGGGYYDRWLAAHRDVTAVGCGFAFAEIPAAAFAARPYDVPLALVVTERGVA